MKKKLIVINENSICFELHEKYNVNCQRKKCNNWALYPESKNCIILASRQGPKTLQEIGKIYNLTRMRICQIEKNIYKKIKSFIEI